MEQVKRKKVINGNFTGIIIALILSFIAGSCGIGGSNDYEALVKTSDEMNKSYPAKVDDDTRLDSTNVQKEPLTLNYYYTIVTVEKESLTVNLQDVVAQIKKGAQENLDKAPEMAEFRNKNIALKYNYSDKNGVFLTDFTINPTKQ